MALPNHIKIGHRLLVAAPGVEVAAAPGQIVLRIDADGAFGDGAHPTTQLCLAALVHHARPGALIDLGTGTGVLAIAAAKLGATPILAVEIDAAAVQLARANVARNGAAAGVQVKQGSLAEVVAGCFGLTQAPLVVANILAHVLVDFFCAGVSRCGDARWPAHPLWHSAHAGTGDSGAVGLARADAGGGRTPRRLALRDRTACNVAFDLNQLIRRKNTAQAYHSPSSSK